ncbi:MULTISPECIES: hypothetical protein [unclassified Coleofasciculus]|uniref:hypothetical protein n=1 Tax=unclassified Coleofasciculus TaxID=2692782 RepID=UPI001882BA13|nr:MULTISPECIES: hypothetical protein [unclassified Coleofasciculus]MBE9124811.1 hypothetical protein [Coleofasciculus sp. LEGE 07081]MBE9147716.1 hypothetical protein [Coleofasciculus sp. LEGE 07092]
MDLLALDPSQVDIILKYQPQLETLGVNLEDESLQETINGYPYNLESAIQAFIEFSAKGKLEKPNLYLIKALRNGWKPRNSSTAPHLPVRTVADFDTGQSLEERIENYRQLCEIVKNHCHRSKKITRPSKPRRNRSLSSQRPDAATVEEFMADSILRPEMEKAILQHPEWGYEITADGVREIEF